MVELNLTDEQALRWKIIDKLLSPTMGVAIPSDINSSLLDKAKRIEAYILKGESTV